MDALAVCIRPLLLHPTALPDIPVDAMLAQVRMFPECSLDVP
jgi:hypothetical protein